VAIVGSGPAGLAAADQLNKAGLEKTRVLKKKPAQWVFLVFVGFLFFLGFFLHTGICPEERVFRGFSVSRILLGASRL
jgi:hypothetical protein